jgi:hypothetical protein
MLRSDDRRDGLIPFPLRDRASGCSPLIPLPLLLLHLLALSFLFFSFFFLGAPVMTEEDEDKIRVWFAGGDRWLVFDASSARRLRGLRVIGDEIGTLAAHPSQSDHLTLPAAIPPPAARMLLRRGLACVVRGSPPPAALACAHGDAVFEALWAARGCFVTRGSKLGADWVAYAGDPLRYHGHTAVSV